VPNRSPPAGSAPPASGPLIRPVTEGRDCVADLAADVRCLDPDSAVPLSDDSAKGTLMDGMKWLDGAVHIVPEPHPMHGGTLHALALGWMWFALAGLDFDAPTVVDSGQLLIRSGNSERRRQTFADHPAANADKLTRTPGAAAAPSSAAQLPPGGDDSVSVQRLDAPNEAKEATRTIRRRQEDVSEEDLV
jgi:hypothetical protein